ncbi:thiamine phosphate synthase [Rubrivivax gelatinosus]|uniref:thiamine phosphate synthase n=1 Tax=Rubrivivax gelatinosus TaxID=28068 RepID=UPI001902FD2E|nr:thiamine phosphate synthase [Rubrivivax gelatinosus]MBK1614690.1 thiamine phosphate synthase [Rubrivivax gelatinosus]
MTEHATPMRGWGAEALRLMLVTDDALAGGRPLEEIVAAAVQGGVRCVQLREKHLGTRAFVARGRGLKALLAPRRVPLVINDRVDVALACGADGVHLGQSDMAVEDARRLLPPAVFIGWSVETLDDVRRAAALPLDYLGTSPVFATTTKLDAAPAWGLDGLRAVRAATALPLVAIGGLHAGNAAQVLAHGADGIAVVSAICSAADPEAAARELALAVAEGAR